MYDVFLELLTYFESYCISLFSDNIHFHIDTSYRR